MASIGELIRNSVYSSLRKGGQRVGQSVQNVFGTPARPSVGQQSSYSPGQATRQQSTVSNPGQPASQPLSVGLGMAKPYSDAYATNKTPPAYTGSGGNVPATPQILNPNYNQNQSGQNPQVLSSQASGQVDYSPIMAELEKIKQNALKLQSEGATDSSTPSLPDVEKAEKTVTSAEKTYQDSLKISPEELSTQEDLDKLIESAKKGFQDVKGQAIPMEFITGQLKATEERANLLKEPLDKKLARLQAQRLSSQEASKFALERADAEADRERETEPGFTLSEGQRRYDAEGNLIAGTSGATQDDPNRVLSVEEAKKLGVDFGTTVSQAISMGKTPGEVKPGTFKKDLAIKGKETVASLMKIGLASPGIFGKTAAFPWPDAARSDAFRNYKAQIDTLKGNIIPAALSAMREASKTGGALGQVSDREGAWLSASLGALDMAQSPKAAIEQLKLIEESFDRWIKAVDDHDAESQSDGEGEGGGWESLGD